MNNSKKILYRVLHSALKVIRAEGKAIGNKKLYHLCNLLHNLPLQLMHADNDEDFSRLFLELKARSEAMGLEKWFEAEINELETEISDGEEY
jgi:hypothetical protein